MKQEEKELILKEFCERIPYGVMCIEFDTIIVKARSIEHVGNDDYYANAIHDGFGNVYPLCAKIEDVKLFLRPMSSMTEDEDKEFASLQTDFYTDGFLYPTAASNMMNWLNAHHFDYNGLIEKGLALEAPEDMYKSE